MDLKVEGVRQHVMKVLARGEWTVEKLAKAKASDLTGYKGIGMATAWKIIVAARRADKERARATSPPAPTQWSTRAMPPRGIYTGPTGPPPPPTEMSERVRRIYEGLTR
ncbi:MAG: hypothetical protein V3W44_02010 [Dehalococcoidales bacterium]